MYIPFSRHSKAIPRSMASTRASECIALSNGCTLAFTALAPHGPNPPFPLVSSFVVSDRPRSRPGREAAKRTLDGEDRSDTMKREGKGGLFQAFPQG